MHGWPLFVTSVPPVAPGETIAELLNPCNLYLLEKR